MCTITTKWNLNISNDKCSRSFYHYNTRSNLLKPRLRPWYCYVSNRGPPPPPPPPLLISARTWPRHWVMPYTLTIKRIANSMTAVSFGRATSAARFHAELVKAPSYTCIYQIPRMRVTLSGVSLRVDGKQSDTDIGCDGSGRAPGFTQWIRWS